MDRKNLYIKAFDLRSEVYNHIGDTDNAVKDLKRAIANIKRINKEKIRLVFNMVNIMSSRKNDYEGSENILNNIKKYIRKNTLTMAEYCSLKGQNFRYLRKNDRALENIEKSIELKKRFNKAPVKELNLLGMIHRDNGDLDGSLKCLHKAYDLSIKMKMRFHTAVTANSLGLIYLDKGDLESSLKYYRKYLEVSKKIGYTYGETLAYGNISVNYLNRGRIERGLEYSITQMDLAEKYGYTKELCSAYSNIGGIHIKMNDHGKAIPFFYKCLELSKKIGYKKGIGNSLNNIGVIYQEKGEYKKAMQYFKTYHDLTRDIGDYKGIMVATINLGLVHKDMGKYEEALGFFIEALQYSESRGYKLHTAVALLKISQCKYKIDTEDKSILSYLLRAEELFIEMKNTEYIKEVKGFIDRIKTTKKI